jgi:hypothetical protein
MVWAAVNIAKRPMNFFVDRFRFKNELLEKTENFTLMAEGYLIEGFNSHVDLDVDPHLW